MNLFYAAFIPGLQDVVSDVLKERLSDLKIIKLVDGAVIFETETTYDKLNFFCFNNIFAVIDVAEKFHTKARGHGGNILDEYINTVTEGIGNTNIIINNSKNIQSFRIVALNENIPAAIDYRLRAQAENYISRLSALKVNRSLPDTEFWFLHRSEGFCVFMKRLTLRSSWDKTLHKGELPPPLAWTLCRLARLKHSDAVLDPFCGYGSIPQEALKHFHVTNFTACDNNSEAVSYTQSRFKNNKIFSLHKRDYCELPALIGENSIDAIVTDPPWGHFRETKDSDFLLKMSDIFYKLLKKGGRAVVLCANDGNFTQFSRFESEAKIPILLSGKKALIIILNKN